MNLQDTVNRELLRFEISRHATFTCPITNTVLDVRTAVLVDARSFGGRFAVVSGEGWDHHKDIVVRAVLAKGGADFEVIDGRTL